MSEQPEKLIQYSFQNLWSFIPLGILGMSLLGCSQAKPPDIHIEVVNVGTVYLTDVAVYFGERDAMAGVLAAGASAIHGFFGGPLTPEARVVFRPNDGPVVEQMVSVPPLKGKGGKWGFTLTFNIDSDRGNVDLVVSESGKRER